MRPWLNGTIRGGSADCIAADDRGFTLGDGVFETLRVLGGRPLRTEAHLRRLREGAAVLGIPVDQNNDALAQAMALTLAANDIHDGSLRLTLSRGPAPRGLATPGAVRPTLLMMAAPAVPQSGPAHVVVATATRRNERSVSSRIKSLSYLDNVLARREAELAGADDAILLNTQGRVAEATAATLVLLQDGVLLTPTVADGALPGIVRGVLIGEGMLRAAPVSERALRRAEAAFLCNSLGTRCIASLDGLAVATREDLARRFDTVFTGPTQGPHP